MRIIFINPVGFIGGAERVLLTLLVALRSAEPELQLYLIVGTKGPLIQAVQNLGISVQLLKLPDSLNQLGDSRLSGQSPWIKKVQLLLQSVTALPALLRYRRQLSLTIRDLRPDLVHSNGIKTHLLMALAAPKSVPVIWHIHDFYGVRPLITKALRWASNRATKGIAISQAVANDAKMALPQLPIQVIYNAVDPQVFSPSPLSTTLEPENLAARGNDSIRIGLVATYARWKGHDVFLEAAAQVVRQSPDLPVCFDIVGSPLYQTKGSQFSRQELEAIAATLQIANQVRFIDFQLDVASVYRTLDIVVHASTQPEPFGLTIVEAMACGKPAIVSQAGGATELFTPHHDAIGVQPGDVGALAAAMQFLLENPEHRDRLARNARETVLKQFNQERLGPQILSVYQTLISADVYKFAVRASWD